MITRDIIVNSVTVGTISFADGTPTGVMDAKVAEQVLAYTPVTLPSSDITITSDTNIVAENISIYGDASSVSVSALLQSAAACSGQLKMFKKIDSTANTFTIKAYGTEQIQNITSSNTLVITSQGTSVILRCDGVKWYVVA